MGRRDVARFLRHLWLSQFGDLKSKGLYSEIKEHLTNNKTTSIDFAQACVEACEDYLKLIEVDKSLPKDASKDVEGMVRYLSVQNSLPLLLSAHKCLSDSDFTKLAKEHYSKSEINMTRDLLKETSWDETTIRKRAKALSKIAIQIWR